MRPRNSAAQAISLRGSGNGARSIQRPALAAFGTGESKTRCWVATSGSGMRPAGAGIRRGVVLVAGLRENRACERGHAAGEEKTSSRHGGPPGGLALPA
jgi:hypothetical protein